MFILGDLSRGRRSWDNLLLSRPIALTDTDNVNDKNMDVKANFFLRSHRHFTARLLQKGSTSFYSNVQGRASPCKVRKVSAPISDA